MPGTKRAYSSRRRTPYRRRARRSYRRSTVPRYRIGGRGDYKTWWKSWKPFRKRWFKPYTGTLAAPAGALGGAIGTAIAPGIGTTIGTGLGTLGGMAVDRIMGWGDYTIQKNVLTMPSQSSTIPLFGKGSIRVRHKEYIATIISSTEFRNASYNLNPGLFNSFPWLSTIAQNFEQYEWNGLVFQYIPTSGDALSSTNAALGKVCMATDYNAVDAEYVSMPQMMGTEFSNIGKPSEAIMHAIECAPSEQPVKKYWVRTGPHPSDTDLRLYDHGKFQIAVSGQQENAFDLGDLWVTYDVTLSKPVLSSITGDTIPTTHVVFTGVSAANPFGSTRTVQYGSNIARLGIDNNSIFWPNTEDTGRFMVIYWASGPAPTVTIALPTITPVGCHTSNLFSNSTVSMIANDGATATEMIWIAVFEIDEVNARIDLSGGTYPTNPGGEMIIQKIPNDLL